MAGDWIKMLSNLAETEEVIGMAEALDREEDLIVGKLHRLWAWADGATTDGTVKVSRRWIDRKTGIEGFAAAMIAENWLVEDGEHMTFPNFEKHNGNSAKKRASDSKRAAKNRGKTSVSQNSRKQSDEKRTKTRPTEEKRREEKIIDETNVSSCGEVNLPLSEPMTEFEFETVGKGSKSWRLSQAKFDEYVEAFPGIAVDAEIRKARQWIRDNPANRKTPRGMPGFLTRWLTRATNRGPPVNNQHEQKKHRKLSDRL